MPEIILENQHIRLGILPEVGASLSFLTYKNAAGVEKEILRPFQKNKAGEYDVNDASLFLMLPYCGRIRGGGFPYWGIVRKVPKNQGGIADPIHGDGWKSAWQVASQTPESLTLQMQHEKGNGGYPFAYTAEVVYTLEGHALSIQMSLHNPAALPMPCGIGIHPFFRKTKDVILEFETRDVWSHESDPIFDKPYPCPEGWCFKNGKALKNMVFDTCFGGFKEKAKITYPQDGLSIQMSADDLFHHIVLYAPRGKDFFCLEPTTMASNAFNLASTGVIGTGIKSIGPKQSLTGRIILEMQG